MKKTIWLVMCLFIALYACSDTQPLELQLDGNWQFRAVNDSTRWLPAKVPGNVHVDLLANHLIANPLIGCNSEKMAWVDSLSWEYRRTFDLPDAFKLNKPIVLVCDGLDTYAEVFVNDQLVLETDNMFRQWEVDCSAHLRHGENCLRVRFKPALLEARKLADSLHLKLPGGEWAVVRKAPYHFGWDWGPRLLSCGIWKSLRLRQIEQIQVENPAFLTYSVDNENATLSLMFHYRSAKHKKYNLQVVDEDNGKVLYRSDIQLDKPNGNFFDWIDVAHPILWWPNGHGAQHLYNLQLRLKHGNRTVYSKRCKVGIHTVHLVTEQDTAGQSFYFVVNNNAIFAKGANVIPPHPFISQVSDSMWISIAENAKRANFNMLRVWGGGVYPPDVFMEACSERGILVWQDFMFACSMYPSSAGFLENVRVEAEQQIQRLRAHTSLALWCGNNEVDEGWHNWGWQTDLTKCQVDSLWNGYKDLFHNMLDSLVMIFDDRCYWPSSPMYGWGRNESMSYGDSHYWGVWWGLEPIARYGQKVPRFMSEYGMQSAPSLKILKQFDSLGVLPDSVEMRCHQKHPTGFQNLDAYLRMEGFAPRSLAEWVYDTQVLQALAYSQAIKAQRFAQPRCMGTLFWQLNDCWPAVSWSTIDYLGEWKAAQWTVAQEYWSVTARALVRANKLRVEMITDSLNTVTGLANVQVVDAEGNTLFTQNFNVVLPPNEMQHPQAQLITEIPLKKYRINPANCAVWVEFTPSQGAPTNHVLFLEKAVDAESQNVDIQCNILHKGNGGLLILRANKPLYFLQISAADENCKFSENFIHIKPGVVSRVSFTGNPGAFINFRSLKFQKTLNL